LFGIGLPGNPDHAGAQIGGNDQGDGHHFHEIMIDEVSIGGKPEFLLSTRPLFGADKRGGVSPAAWTRLPESPQLAASSRPK
jgi:hypothetical protein